MLVLHPPKVVVLHPPKGLSPLRALEACIWFLFVAFANPVLMGQPSAELKGLCAVLSAYGTRLNLTLPRTHLNPVFGNSAGFG